MDSLLLDRGATKHQFDVSLASICGVPGVEQDAVLSHAVVCSFGSHCTQILHLAGVQAKISAREEPAASTMLVAS